MASKIRVGLTCDSPWHEEFSFTARLGPYSYLCGHRRAKGSKSVEVLHFYYLAHSWHARDEVAWTLPNILWAQQNQNGNAGSKSVEVLHFYYLLARSTGTHFWHKGSRNLVLQRQMGLPTVQDTSQISGPLARSMASKIRVSLTCDCDLPLTWIVVDLTLIFAGIDAPKVVKV